MAERFSRIVGLGSYVPDRVVTNHDLGEWMDTSDEWIVERTGIHERRWVDEGARIGSSDLGVEAARRALDDAGLDVGDVDMIIFATLSPDHQFPGTGVFLQQKLGLGPRPVLDIRQQCTGFVYGLATADAYIRTGMAERVLLVGAEVHSTGLDRSTRGRDVTVLFGDGAGAAVVAATDDPARRLLSAHLYADGRFAKDLWLDGMCAARRPPLSVEDLEQGRLYPRMNGRKVFKHAVTRMPEVAREALAAHGCGVEDIDLLVCHQANLRINELVQQALGIPPEKVHNNIQRYGNTTAASIPLCLDEARREGKLHPGDLVLLVAFGAGFTWGAVLLRF